MNTGANITAPMRMGIAAISTKGKARSFPMVLFLPDLLRSPPYESSERAHNEADGQGRKARRKPDQADGVSYSRAADCRTYRGVLRRAPFFVFFLIVHKYCSCSDF